MAKKRQFSESQLSDPLEPPSLIKRVGSGVVSGLSAIGNLLDTPGSMVRDVLAGENPFDQLASPLSSLNRTSGRDLLRKHGLIGSQDTYGNFFGGLGAEIALDPTLPFTGFLKGGLSAGGKLAKSAGLLDDIGRVASKAAGKAPGSIGRREALHLLTPSQLIQHGGPEAAQNLAIAAGKSGINLADHMDKPLGGLLEFWPTGDLLGTGQTAQKVARGLDMAASTVRNARIPGTSIRPIADLHNLVSQKSYKATTAAQQQTAGFAHGLKEAARAGVKLKEAEWANRLKDVGLDLDRHGPEVRNWIEFPDQAPAHVKPIVDDIRSFLDTIPSEAQEVGIKMGNANVRTQLAGGQGQYASHFLPDKLAKGAPGAKSQPFAATAQSRQGRFSWGFSSAEGSAGISKLAKRVKELRDMGVVDPQDIADDLKITFPGLLQDQFLTGEQYRHWLKNVPSKHGLPTVQNALAMAGKGLKGAARYKPKDSWMAAAKSLSRLSDEVLEAGIYANHPLVDIGRSALGMKDAIASAKVALGHIADMHAGTGSFIRTAAQAGDVPLKQVLKGLKLDPGDTGSGAMRYLFDQIMAAGGQAPDLASLSLKEGKKAIRDYLQTAVIDGDTTKFLTQMREGISLPETTNAWLKLYDDFSKITKAIFTSLKPSFHGRNLPSGQAANALADQFSGAAVRDMDRLIKGKVIEGAAQNPILQAEATKRGIQGLTDEQATKLLGELMYAHEVTGSYGLQELATQGPGIGSSLQDILHGIPGAEPFSFGNTAKKLTGQAGTTWNPLKGTWQGLGGAEKSTFAPLAAGEDLGHYVESLNRGAPFWALLQNGVAPQEAAKRVLEAQVGYQNRFYTKFEQQALQRLFLFYKFCVPSDHEALTINGWKTYDKISEGELLLGYDMESGELQWTPALAINVFDHDGELIQFSRKKKTRTLAFQFTDNHRWPVRKRRRRLAAIGPRKECQHSDPVFAYGDELADGDRLICAGEFRGSKSILDPRLAAILGWLVTDGHIQWRNGSGFGVIYQHPKKFLKEIRELVGHDRQYSPHPQTGVVAVPVAKEDMRKILTVFRGKQDMPSIAGRLSRDAAEAMWQAMFMAEGDTKKTTGLQFFAQDPTINKDVLDAFQILCLLTGRSANLAQQGCTIRKRGQYQIAKNQMSRVPYQGKVWCPTTALGTWVMRHDGQVVITGNSKGMLPFTLQMLIDNPGGKLAQTLRSINQFKDEDELVPSYVAETASIPVGQIPGMAPLEPGAKRYITGLGMGFEDPAQFAVPSLQNAGLEAMSRLNPLLKGPLEHFTGQSFFQRGPLGGGRALEDLDPALGRTLSNLGQLTGLREKNTPITFPGSKGIEHLLSNSPLSTLLTTARTATDPRKGPAAKAINLLTGIRATDVSPAAQDRELISRAGAIEKELLGAREYRDTYVPKAKQEEFTPKQKELHAELKALRRLLEERRKHRQQVTA
jgi:hypothetical protein